MKDFGKLAGEYHSQPEYNCAQSVIKAFEHLDGIDENVLIEFKEFGGGKAPDGICGALYAGKAILKDQPEKIATLEEKFVEKADFNTCIEIKTETGFPCRDCVELAASEVAKLL